MSKTEINFKVNFGKVLGKLQNIYLITINKLWK